ncbi:Dyp-type peroxidase [Actinokineospora diospyrosa]|uniref:Deferrochelatase/peroxidase EfeB n=1 Tax=Actinokineospora diospyrosa TaxID=103728 RepID=A0ABT1I5K4_9PSEU|nr:Dyp-type peroxidase [Actinokineospora diospyrosa]MCP2267908.1 deferrochelatase/peroxidase EfeB [Actinokineospora diospyrosa]
MTVDRRSFLAAVGTLGVASCAAPEVAAHPPVSSAPHTALHAFDVTARDRAGLATALEAARSLPGAAVSVGASLFDARFGLTRPRLLTPMPAFRNDVLDPAWCHGDVLVQLTADHPVGTVPDIPDLTPRWQMTAARHDRNLFGFKEGTANPADPDPHIRIHPEDPEPPWTVGGSYQVVRLIRLAMPIWNADSVPAQERVFGRHKATGAPLGQQGEHDLPNYPADPHGSTIPFDSHIRRANQAATPILRRGYTYRLTPDNEGHVFICYQRDLVKGFATIQSRLAGEALERYTLPFGGGYFFLLPASDPRQTLLA